MTNVAAVAYVPWSIMALHVQTPIARVHAPIFLAWLNSLQSAITRPYTLQKQEVRSINQKDLLTIFDVL